MRSTDKNNFEDSQENISIKLKEVKEGTKIVNVLSGDLDKIFSILKGKTYDEALLLLEQCKLEINKYAVIGEATAIVPESWTHPFGS